jgi:hypothetical protein
MVQDIPVPHPDISTLVLEDDEPVDNLQSAKQQRLLVEPLYSSKPIPTPFLADANLGLFYAVRQNPIVPDVFLSLGVEVPSDWSRKENRSYFFWEFGKPPEVAIAIVSNREGQELTRKLRDYAQIGIAYYVVFDPLRQIQDSDLMNGALLRVFGLTVGRYRDISEPFWLETVGLGLTLWNGEFEQVQGLWLRWCDRQGAIVPTGAEDRDRERSRAERLAERLRSLGVDPDTPDEA